MRKLLKILSIIIISLLAFLLLLTIGAKIFEDEIAEVAVQQASKAIEAPIEIESVNFNLIRGFPHSTVEFNNLWLKNPEAPNDTIAGVQQLFVSINSRAAINGQYLVEKIIIDGLTLNYLIDLDSLSNIDFLMSLVPEASDEQDSTVDSTLMYVNLDELLLKDISCSYYDATTNTGGTVLIPRITMRGNIWGNDYTVETDGKISLRNLRYENYNTDLIRKASLDFNFDYNNGDVKINHFAIESDGLNLTASGNAYIGDSTYLNTTISSHKIDIGQLSQYIPQEMMQELGLINAQGVLSFNSKISGEVSDSILPLVEADFKFLDGAITTTDYPAIKHFSIEGEATNGQLKNDFSTEINISSLRIATDSSRVEASLKAKDLIQPNYSVKTKGSILIDEFSAFIPDSTVESINGRINWQIATHGKVPKVIGDSFTDYVLARSWANVSFQNINCVVDSTLSIEDFSTEFSYRVSNLAFDNLHMTVPEYDVTLQNSSADISFDGLLTEMDSMAVELNDLHLEIDDHTIDLQGSLSNLYHPLYQVESNIDLNLDQLQKFIPDSLGMAISGQLAGSMSSAGQLNLDSIETQGMALAFENTELALKVQNISVQMEDELSSVKNLNLDMGMKPDTVSIHLLSGNYLDLPFTIRNTQVTNAYQSVVLNQKETLKVITSIELGDINYPVLEAKLLAFEESDTTEDSTTTDSIVPTNYLMDIKGDLAISRVIFDNYYVDSTMTIRDLDLTNLDIKFRIRDSSYIADSIQFNTYDGYMLTSARYDTKADGRDVIAMRTYIEDIDIKRMLYGMDDFGQKDVTYKNINGKLTSDMDMQFTMYGDSFPLDKVRMKGNFTLKDGGVFDFEPATELSVVSNINELDNIQFETVTTDVFVYKGIAYIPKTEIANSAVDITPFGKQSLTEDEWEYHMGLKLKEVMSKNDKSSKQKKKKKRGSEYDHDGRNLVAKKIDGKENYGFSNTKEREAIRRKIRVQEMALNIIFHPKLFDFSTEDKIESDE